MTPVYNGYLMETAAQRSQFGGINVSEYLSEILLKEYGVTFTTTFERETILPDLKHFDGRKALKDAYTLPDGQVLDQVSKVQELSLEAWVDNDLVLDKAAAGLSGTQFANLKD